MVNDGKVEYEKKNHHNGSYYHISKKISLRLVKSRCLNRIEKNADTASYFLSSFFFSFLSPPSSPPEEEGDSKRRSRNRRNARSRGDRIALVGWLETRARENLHRHVTREQKLASEVGQEAARSSARKRKEGRGR